MSSNVVINLKGLVHSSVLSVADFLNEYIIGANQGPTITTTEAAVVTAAAAAAST